MTRTTLARGSIIDATYYGRRSVDRGHVHLARDRTARVVEGARALGERDHLVRHLAIRNLLEEVVDAVEASAGLVVRLDDPPRRLLDVRAIEHVLLRLRVLLPAPARLEVHGAELP